MCEVSKKKVIGITGSMGSGKSQVSKIVKKQYPTLDCDKVNAKLLYINHPGYNELKKRNLIVLDCDGNIDKMALSLSMFENPEIKKEVEDILHPLIFEEMHQWIDKQTSPLVFIEMPLLFETQSESIFDSIWCVVVRDDIALNRLEKYRHISNEEAKRRLKHQMSPQTKMQKSTHVIYNNGSLIDLEKEVKQKIKEEENSWN